MPLGRKFAVVDAGAVPVTKPSGEFAEWPLGDGLNEFAFAHTGTFYTSNTPGTVPKEQTDDAMIAGYNDGLPFMVLADGAYGSNAQLTHQVVRIIADRLPVLIANIQDIQANTGGELLDKKNTIIANFIQQISEVAKKLGGQANECQFNLGVQFAYTNPHGDKKIIAFGLGDGLLAVYRHETASYETLKPAENLASLAGESADEVQAIVSGEIPVPNHQQMLPLMGIDRYQASHVEVDYKEGDMMLGLVDGAYEHLPIRITAKTVDGGRTVFSSSLSVPELRGVLPGQLAERCKEANQTRLAHLDEEVRSAEDAVRKLTAVKKQFLAFKNATEGGGEEIVESADEAMPVLPVDEAMPELPADEPPAWEAIQETLAELNADDRFNNPPFQIEQDNLENILQAVAEKIGHFETQRYYRHGDDFAIVGVHCASEEQLQTIKAAVRERDQVVVAAAAEDDNGAAASRGRAFSFNQDSVHHSFFRHDDIADGLLKELLASANYFKTVENAKVALEKRDNRGRTAMEHSQKLQTIAKTAKDQYQPALACLAEVVLAAARLRFNNLREQDRRNGVTIDWPRYREVLKAANKTYEFYMDNKDKVSPTLRSYLHASLYQLLRNLDVYVQFAEQGLPDNDTEAALKLYWYKQCHAFKQRNDTFKTSVSSWLFGKGLRAKYDEEVTEVMNNASALKIKLADLFENVPGDEFRLVKRLEQYSAIKQQCIAAPEREIEPVRARTPSASSV